MYPIRQALISKSRSGQPLNPSGLAIHSTATPGATAAAEQRYFNSSNRKSSAHFFVDWTEIVRTVPENEQAWHAGPTANKKLLSIEMCEPRGHDPVAFEEVWKRTVWLAADICRRHNISIGLIMSHAMISATWHETDHTDPTAYFAAHGKTFSDFLSAVKQEINPQVNQESEIEMAFSFAPETAWSSEHEFGGLVAAKGKDVWANLRSKSSAPTIVTVTIFRESGKAVSFDVELTDGHPIAVLLSDKVDGSFSARFKSAGIKFAVAVTQYQQ